MMSVAFIMAMAGVASHLGYFIYGEHHMQAPMIAGAGTITYTAIFLFLFYQTNLKIAILESSSLFGSYVIALHASMMIYRVFFHRLRNFPGPSLAKISKLWHVAQLRESKNHLVLEDLRRTYGDFVRTGESGHMPS